MTCLLPALFLPILLILLSIDVGSTPKLVQCWSLVFAIIYIVARLFTWAEIFRILLYFPLDAYVSTWAKNIPHVAWFRFISARNRALELFLMSLRIFCCLKLWSQHVAFQKNHPDTVYDKYANEEWKFPTAVEHVFTSWSALLFFSEKRDVRDVLGVGRIALRHLLLGMVLVLGSAGPFYGASVLSDCFVRGSPFLIPRCGTLDLQMVKLDIIWRMMIGVQSLGRWKMYCECDSRNKWMTTNYLCNVTEGFKRLPYLENLVVSENIAIKWVHMIKRARNN